MHQIEKRKNSVFCCLLPIEQAHDVHCIRQFGQRVRCVWRNKEPTPKGEDVKLITQWKHVPDTIG